MRIFFKYKIHSDFIIIFMFISVFNDKTWNEKIEKKERRVINK